MRVVNFEIILLLAIPIAFIVGIFVFFKIALFFMDTQLKRSNGNMIKIYNHNDLGKLKNSNVVNQKLILKDKNGNIIKELSSTEDSEDDIFGRIREQMLSSECDDGIIRDEFGNKIAEFGSKENMEEFKRKITDDEYDNENIVDEEDDCGIERY